MDRKKREKLITDNMKAIFGFALTRLGSVQEAECLASDILYALLRSVENLHDEQRFYGYLWKVAENQYKDYLRRKGREAGRTAEWDEQRADDGDFVTDEIIGAEELNLLRRELSLLSGQYREATVLYYMDGCSCAGIAEKLQISTEMVKYYLFRARKIIREGMNMERLLGEKSYRPGGFAIDYWGSAGFDPDEYREFRIRKLKGNILLAAYYSPMTAQELSIELGVALPYLEDELALLLEGGYLAYKNGKYLTNIPIFTAECTQAIDTARKGITLEIAERFMALSDTFSDRFGHRFSDANLVRWQKILLCLHFALDDEETTSDVIWGRSYASPHSEDLPEGIQGIYNGCEAEDGRGWVIAMNFRQTLNAQQFSYSLTQPIVCTAVDCYKYLPQQWQDDLAEWGYVLDGRANFAVWTEEEYRALREILTEGIAIVAGLLKRTSELAAGITADLAPGHIRQAAEAAGAVVYRFNAIDDLVNILTEQNWLEPVTDEDKPALCVVRK